MAIFALTPQGLNAFKALSRLSYNRIRPEAKRLISPEQRNFFEGTSEKATIPGKIGFPNQEGGENHFTFEVLTKNGETQNIRTFPEGQQVNLEEIVEDLSTQKEVPFCEWFDNAISRYFVEQARLIGIKFW